MFLRVISVILCYSLVSLASAQDDVARWLQRMGCNELLANYLEQQLEEGNRNEKIRAAKQLADVYAMMLAQANQDDDQELLKRAISLFDRIPEAGTTELRLQLYRATYIAAEQILERYRLRISDIEEANVAIAQLHEVADDLDSLQQSLKKSIRSSRSENEQKKHQLGLVTSYLAWTHYYIAWHEGDQAQASLAANLFAEILLGDRPSLLAVSLDLKSHETGARAILGIALCKSILNDPAGPEPWFDELEDFSTWSSVRQIVPLWKFFLAVDKKQWDNVLASLNTNSIVDKGIMYRVSATHSLENYSHSTAKQVAKRALAGLVELGQLGIVSDVVTKYGDEALPKNGFISQYIEGDIRFRKAKKLHASDEPAQNEQILNEFSSIASLFNKATQSHDAQDYTSLVDDCQFMLGLSYYYSAQFENAAKAFQKSARGDTKEQSIWMAIVSLNYINELNSEQQLLKEDLSNFYVQNWPDTHHATQLTIHRSESENPTPQNIEDLLSIPYSNPKYEDAQRQAARSLYALWEQASSLQRAEVGHKYISVALPLLMIDLEKKEDVHATEIAAVRALRLLELSLHPEVQRIVVAERALESLQAIEERQTYSVNQFLNEINFRKIQVQIKNEETARAADILLDMIGASPNDRWTTLASTTLWNEISTDESTSNTLKFAIGHQILNQLQERQFSSREFIGIATATAQAAYALFELNEELSFGEEAIRISRVLVNQKPRIVEILILNAQIEMQLGDLQVALSRWKTISSGSKRGSLQWLQARFNTISILSLDSPDEAIAVLEQHEILYPNYGAEPYGSKLKNLHFQLKKGQNGT